MSEEPKKEPEVKKEKETPVIAIFGSTGKTGRVVLKQALETGLSLRLSVRSKSKLLDLVPEVKDNPKVVIIEGSMSPETADKTIVPGVTAVICILGHSKTTPDDLLEKSTRTVLASAAKLATGEVKAPVCLFQSGNAVLWPGDTKGTTGGTIIAKLLPAKWAKDLAAAAKVMQEAKDQPWIAVRCSAMTDGKRTDKYVIMKKQTTTGLGRAANTAVSSISRANAADFYLRLAKNPTEYLNSAPVIQNSVNPLAPKSAYDKPDVLDMAEEGPAEPMDPEDAKVYEISQKWRSMVEIKDQTYHMKTYKQVFVGKDAVAAAVKAGLAPNAKAAVEQGELLRRSGLFDHVTKDHRFEDGALFYRFLEKGPDGKVAQSKIHNCQVCDASFGGQVRQYTCAHCSKVVCEKCSQYKAGGKRSCEACWKLHGADKSVDKKLTSTHHTVHTEIVIDAPPEVVWSTLTDFKNYSWSTTGLSGCEGEFPGGDKGADILYRITSNPTKLHHTIIDYKEGEGFAWSDPILGFKDYHRFQVHKIDDTHTRFVQSDEFIGGGAYLLGSTFRKGCRTQYETYNLNLKREAEKRNAAKSA